MAVFQFVGLCPGSTSQQLIAKADAHARADGLVFQERAYMLHRLAALFRVARTVSQKQAVKLQLVEVVVPRYTNHLKSTTYQATDDVGLNAAVHQYHPLPSTFIISNDLLAAHLLHPVHASVVLLSCMLRHCRSPINKDSAHHHAMLAEHLREPPRVNAGNGRNLLTFQP